MPLFNSELPSFNKKPVSPDTSVSVSAPQGTFTGQSGEQPCVLGSCRAVVWRTRGGGAQNGPPPALECLVQLLQAKLPPRSRSPCPASCSHCPCAFRVWQLTAESEGSRIGRDVKSEGEPFLKDCSDGSLCMWITENYSRWTGNGRLRLLSFSLLIGGVLNPTTASTLRGMPARALRGRNQCTGVKH